MNSFGQYFRVTLFGESHGPIVGVILDGVRPGIKLSEDDFSEDLKRRRPGAIGTTPRKEEDRPLIQSGLYQGMTTGAPLLILFSNRNMKSGDYESLKNFPRPGHADFTAQVKYKGYHDPRGGGVFSGRLTLGLVAAGVVAKKIIAPMMIQARLIQAGGSSDIKKNVKLAREAKDSVGGLIECRGESIPCGLGSPFFNSVESLIAHAVFSIPGIKGIEFGSGFQSVTMKGSQHNDLYIDTQGKTKSNHSGGISGGITNGNPLLFRVAVKPTPSISQAQHTMNWATGQIEKLEITGRHDTCFALRVPVIIEAVTAMVLADLINNN